MKTLVPRSNAVQLPMIKPQPCAGNARRPYTDRPDMLDLILTEDELHALTGYRTASRQLAAHHD